MHRRSPPLPLLVMSIALLGLVPTAAGQGATPAAGTPTAAESGIPTPLLRLVLAELPPQNVAVVGMTCTTFAPGGGPRAVAGAGPVVLLVETGALVARSAEAPQPLLVVGGAGAATETPEPVPAGNERSLEAGAALVVPAGGTAELRNDGGEPAAALELLAALDARFEAETGTTRAVLARREASLPPPPVTLTLGRATIPPGDRLPLPPASAESVVVPVDRAQTFLLTGQTFNRGTTPMPVYVLTIAPAGADAGTPHP